MSVGKELKTLLKEEGRSLKYVSEKTGIPYYTLFGYVSEKSPIPPSKLLCICLVCGIDPKIFGLNDKKSTQKSAS